MTHKITKAIRDFGLLLLVACLIQIISSCGYTLQGRASLPFQGVKIGKIVNKTYELKLEDRMQRLLTEELQKNGLSWSLTPLTPSNVFSTHSLCRSSPLVGMWPRSTRWS